MGGNDPKTIALLLGGFGLLWYLQRRQAQGVVDAIARARGVQAQNAINALPAQGAAFDAPAALSGLGRYARRY